VSFIIKDKDVIVSRPLHGLCGMQVCAKKGTSNERILEVCNAENPSGTMGGWQRVCRTAEDVKELQLTDECLPVDCGEDDTREHILVYC
jgi:hypothetical protein